MHPDFKPVSLFAGLFSEKWVQFEIDEFANWLRSTLPDFDQPHTKPKIPQNAPGEMPRFVLMGGNKTKILEVAPKKINLRWVRKVGNLPLSQLKDEFNSLVSNIIYKTSEYDYSFNRLGIILTLFREFREDGTPVSSNQKLVDYFFQKRDIFEPTPSEAHLNVHTKMKFDEKFSGNRWIRIRPLRRNSDNEDCGIQVEVDLNTLPLPNQTYNLQEIQQFFDMAFQHYETKIDFLNNPNF